MKSFVLALVLASLVVSAPALPGSPATPGQAPFTEKELGRLQGEGQSMCPDGSTVTIRVYAPSPDSVIVTLSRGEVLVAVRQASDDEDRLYVVAEGRWYPIEAAQARFSSGCDIPFGGR